MATEFTTDLKFDELFENGKVDWNDLVEQEFAELANGTIREEDFDTPGNELEEAIGEELEKDTSAHEVFDRFNVINITCFKLNTKKKFLEGHLLIDVLLKNLLRDLTEQRDQR